MIGGKEEKSKAPASSDEELLNHNHYNELRMEKPLYCPSTGVEMEQQETEQEIERTPLSAGSTALLIVDVQPEYWTDCPPVRKDFPNFEENLARTIEIARKQKAKIIWVRADYRKHHSPWLTQFERLRGKKADVTVELPCEPESDEFAWESFATPEGGETVIAKSSWSSTSNTALMDILRVSGIDTVLVCGLITSVCVQHSAFGVFEAGYRTLLVEDACGDRGMARHEAALALYGGYMYELITSKELTDPVKGLQKAKPVWITMDDVKGKNRSNSNELTNRIQTYITANKRARGSSDQSTDTPSERSSFDEYERPSKKIVAEINVVESSTSIVSLLKNEQRPPTVKNSLQT